MIQQSLRRLVYKIASTAIGAKIAAPILPYLDRLVFWITGERMTAVSLITGLPTIFITTRGARTGKERTVPLVATPVDEGLVLIASNWGRERNPSWYYNLVAHPDVTVRRKGNELRYEARALSGEERTRYWKKAADLYGGYQVYQRRTERTIPVILLEPQT